jgi:hypothetical protein
MPPVSKNRLYHNGKKFQDLHKAGVLHCFPKAFFLVDQLCRLPASSMLTFKPLFIKGSIFYNPARYKIHCTLIADCHQLSFNIRHGEEHVFLPNFLSLYISIRVSSAV